MSGRPITGKNWDAYLKSKYWILKCLKEGGGLTYSEIGKKAKDRSGRENQSSMSSKTVSRHLKELVHEGHIVKDGKNYRITERGSMEIPKVKHALAIRENRNQGLCPYTDEICDNWLSSPKKCLGCWLMMDSEIVDWISELNKFDGIETIQSCSGHKHEDGSLSCGHLWFRVTKRPFSDASFLTTLLSVIGQELIEKVTDMWHPERCYEIVFKGLEHGRLKESTALIKRAIESGLSIRRR